MQLMHLMHLKVPGPWGPTFDAVESLASAKGPHIHDSNASKVLAFGADFRCIRFLSIGPEPESNESNESKVLALGPALESLASVYAFDAEAPEGPGGA